jgi:hypothetical protein
MKTVSKLGMTGRSATGNGNSEMGKRKWARMSENDNEGDRFTYDVKYEARRIC